MKLKEVKALRRSVKLTSQEAELLLKNHQLGDQADWDALGDAIYNKLYEIYLNNGEMPYGTAKARTGDPYEWIAYRLETMSEFEYLQFLRQNSEPSAPRLARGVPMGENIVSESFVVTHQKLSHARQAETEQALEAARLLANIMYLQAKEQWKEHQEIHGQEGGDFKTWFDTEFITASDVFVDRFAKRVKEKLHDILQSVSHPHHKPETPPSGGGFMSRPGGAQGVQTIGNAP